MRGEFEDRADMPIGFYLRDDVSGIVEEGPYTTELEARRSLTDLIKHDEADPSLAIWRLTEHDVARLWVRVGR